MKKISNNVCSTNNVCSKSVFRVVEAQRYNSQKILPSPFKIVFNVGFNWCRTCLFISLYGSSFNPEEMWLLSSKIKVGYNIRTFFINQTRNLLKKITGFFDETYFAGNNVIWCCSDIFNFEFSFLMSFWVNSDFASWGCVFTVQHLTPLSVHKALRSLESL